MSNDLTKTKQVQSFKKRWLIVEWTRWMSFSLFLESFNLWKAKRLDGDLGMHQQGETNCSIFQSSLLPSTFCNLSVHLLIAPRKSLKAKIESSKVLLYFSASPFIILCCFFYSSRYFMTKNLRSFWVTIAVLMCKKWKWEQLKLIQLSGTPFH